MIRSHILGLLRTRPWAVLTVRHSTAVAILAVGASFTLVAVALSLSTLRDTPQEEAQVLRMQLNPPLAEPTEPSRYRCTTCGVIERIVMTEDLNGVPLSYEFTVRMHDGSVRRSSAPLQSQWQVGDGIQLLGGGRTWSAP